MNKNLENIEEIEPIQEKIELMKENNEVLEEFRSKVLSLETENKRLNDDYERNIRVFTLENEHLRNSLAEITEKY